jgi:thymidine kinase
MICTINDFPNGYLELIIGPMFSGKTSLLMHLNKLFIHLKITPVIINHIFDNERSGKNNIISHDNKQIDCITLESISNIYTNNNYINNRVVMINEAQFFPNLINDVQHMLNDGKIIYIFGLDGDYLQKPFINITGLIPLCDSVKKLKSICKLCDNGTKTPAIFSHRINTDNSETFLIGDSDYYIPICRKCKVTKICSVV